jgi:adenylate cyclase class IV
VTTRRPDAAIPGTNIETKARSPNLGELARRAAEAGATFEGLLEQTDTYFHVERKWLKLREWAHRRPDGATASGAELIRYERADAAGARTSAYERTPVGDANACREQLAARHGVRGSVTKRRELWIFGSTRIHLDSVDGLGDFVELETVLGEGPQEAYRAEHELLLETLGIERADTVDGSYIDLAGAEALGEPADRGLRARASRPRASRRSPRSPGA